MYSYLNYLNKLLSDTISTLEVGKSAKSSIPRLQSFG